MKQIVNIARVLVGILFIFSGLVKAIDPLGLAYKMQEFFDVWASEGIMKGIMLWLNEQALMLSILMITLEVVLGVALLLGWRTKIVSWLLLMLMLFFTFLTSYVLFSGKIRACGCFGDCIPLTPIQTFTKDIVLLMLVLLILFGRKYIKPIFSGTVIGSIVLISLFGVLGLQWYVIKHLPVKDCLPFKIGNNILELRKMPKDAVPDKYDYVFVYKKDGANKEFKVDGLPDSTWEFVDRKQTLTKGKNNVPLINDFILKKPYPVYYYRLGDLVSTFEETELPDSSWTFVNKVDSSIDVTDQVLSKKTNYYLLFIRDTLDIHADWKKDIEAVKWLIEKKLPVYIITSNYNGVVKRYEQIKAAGKNTGIDILTCDVTSIKTAARNNVTLFLMDGPVVKNKWGGNDIEKALK
ncbi:MAG: BT_3928 family protein [Ferruginibacter sp.]